MSARDVLGPVGKSLRVCPGPTRTCAAAFFVAVVGISSAAIGQTSVPNAPAEKPIKPHPATSPGKRFIVSYTLAPELEKAARASVEANGAAPLHITYSDGTGADIPAERGRFGNGHGTLPQQAFDDVEIAADKQTIGWLATYMFCSQSYPCPLELVIYRSGHVLHRIAPSHGDFWNWTFLKGGREVATESGFPHGENTGEFALYDTATGR